jgi:hypothetical protein
MVHAGLIRRGTQRRISLVLAIAAAAAWGTSAFAASDELHITGVDPGHAIVGHAFKFIPAATDSEHRTLTFGIEHMPSWMSFNTQTGEVTGTPGAKDVGSYPNIVIGVSDGLSVAKLPSYTLVVVADNSNPGSSTAPTISGTPATSDTAGTPYAFQPTAHGPAGDALSFSVLNKPTWANFSIASGMLSGTPSTTQTGTYSNIVVSVSDGKGTAALPAFSIVVKNSSSTPPVTTGSATVKWTPPTANTNGTPVTDLAGIRIFYGNSASNLTQTLQIGANQTTATIANLASGIWYFAGAAYTTSGAQSAMSNVVSASIQ